MGRIRLNQSLRSAEETIAFGQTFAKDLPRGSILALTGDLGAGKTTFVQGLALGLGIEERVQSPTFILLNIYEDLLYHFDLYRLTDERDFIHLGFAEYFEKTGLTVIEWPDRIAKILPSKTVHLHFQYNGATRVIEIR